jgi:peptidoglycan/LPS O-acetylase OafA/YrhL
MHTSKKNYICGLDGLRAIAIIGVVGYHMCPFYIPGGFLGVNLFFVLSGYLIALTTIEKSLSPLSFYGKRIRRIYPALLLVIALTLCTARVLMPQILIGIRPEIISIFFGYNNWFQIRRNASYFTRITGTSPLTHMWSLAVELQFYLLWPLLHWGYGKLRNRRPKAAPFFFPLLAAVSWLIMVLLYQPGKDPTRVYYGTDTRLASLLAGCALALRPEKEKNGKKNNTLKALETAVFIGSLALLGGMYLCCDGRSPFTYYGAMGISILIACVLIRMCADSSMPFGRWLEERHLKALGRRSYEIYLIQYPVIYFVSIQCERLPSAIRMIIILALTAGITIWFHDVIHWFNVRTERTSK